MGAIVDLAGQVEPERGPVRAVLVAEHVRVAVIVGIAAVAVRADCLAGNAYAQGTLLCPAAVCGNRIREGGEECDDGNTLGGDGCSADCFREAPTSDSRS